MFTPHTQGRGVLLYVPTGENREQCRIAPHSESLASTAVSCPVQADVGTSDHAPVVATFRIRLDNGKGCRTPRRFVDDS